MAVLVKKNQGQGSKVGRCDLSWTRKRISSRHRLGLVPDRIEIHWMIVESASETIQTSLLHSSTKYPERVST
jgi:hypothetical protein